MKPNTELTKHTFIDGDFSMDINVSEEERTIYMSQNKVAILLGISGGTVSKYIKKLANSKWDSVSKNEQNDKKVFPSVSTELDLEIIKEIGKRYNPERIEKLENWLYDILPTTDYEIVDNNYEIVRYNQDNLDIPVRFENDGETLWMTAKEMAILFDTTEKNIYYHMENIFEDKELSDCSIFKESLTMGQTGQKYKVALYNLDMILAVGYRIRSEKAVHFRRWANEVIKEHLRFSYFGKSEAYLPVINQEINNRLDILEQRIEKLEPKEHIF